MNTPRRLPDHQRVTLPFGMPGSLPRRLAALALFTTLLPTAQALDCGASPFPFCANRVTISQFAGGFEPPVPYGGFGGGDDCKGKVTRTPVVLVHGNGDSAVGWDFPALPRGQWPEGPSVYDSLIASGYNACEVFGVTYLPPEEQPLAKTANNVHEPARYDIIWRFIEAVKAYTGSQQVDVVTHSLGSSMTLAALDYQAEVKQVPAWASIRRFVNIAGGIRGLNSCVPGTLIARTCEAEQHQGERGYYEFGFFPEVPMWGQNRWTAVHGPYSLREAPLRHKEVAFYTINAGKRDDIHCPATLPPIYNYVRCEAGAAFVKAPNVRAQLDVGVPAPQRAPGWVAEVPSDVQRLFPNDLGGIGHFGARNYTGPMIATMLSTDCRGTKCKGAYKGRVRLTKP